MSSKPRCNYIDAVGFQCHVHPKGGAPFCSKHKSKDLKEVKKSMEIDESPYKEVTCNLKDSDDKIKLDQKLWLHTSIFDKIIERYLYPLEHEERIEKLKNYAEKYGCPCLKL